MTLRTTAERGGPDGPGSLSALDRAQREGAAPGAEWPSGIVSSPLGGRLRARRRLRAARTVLAACALAVGAWTAADALYLQAKARVGQLLLEHAWNEAKAGDANARPWPWADMHPVARLLVPERDIDLLVLAGANGRTLAWGPGHAESSAAPGTAGNAVLTGHRDTHFAFLRDLAPGERIVVERRDGTITVYRVERRILADYRMLRLPVGGDEPTLSLVTCWPFDGVDPGTPLRYAVVARAEGAR